MEKNILQSRVIDVLRFPMIVGVVLWHSFFEGIMGLDIPDSGIPIYHTTSFFISRILASVAVPLFFFIFISFLYFITVQSLIFTAFNGFQQHIKKCRHIQNLLFLTYVSTFTVCYLLFIIYRLPLTLLLLFFVFSCY